MSRVLNCERDYISDHLLRAGEVKTGCGSTFPVEGATAGPGEKFAVAASVCSATVNKTTITNDNI